MNSTVARLFLPLFALVPALIPLQGQTITTNIALGTAVTASGPWSGVALSTITDGTFLPTTTYWQSGTVWWNGTGTSFTVALPGVNQITGFKLQADDNDTYRVEYSLGGGAWTTAWDVPTLGWTGMFTRPNYQDETQWFTLTTPILADSLRITATGGDNSYAISEFQVQGVPEAETGVLLLLGLPALFAVRAVRSRKDRSRAE